MDAKTAAESARRWVDGATYIRQLEATVDRLRAELREVAGALSARANLHGLECPGCGRQDNIDSDCEMPCRACPAWTCEAVDCPVCCGCAEEGE